MPRHSKPSYVSTIENGGKANTVLGWLWLCDGLYWAVQYLTSTFDIKNFFITIWAFEAAFFRDSNIILVVLSIALAVFHLYIGQYVIRQYGSRSKLFLLLGAIVGFVFTLALFPIVPAVYSLRGYLAYRKSGVKPPTKKHRFTWADLQQKSIYAAGVFILIIMGLTVWAYVRSNAPLPKSDEAARTQGSVSQEISGFDFTTGKSIIFGYCTNNPGTSGQCDYTSDADGYSITFPGGDFSGNPRMVFHPLSSKDNQPGHRYFTNHNGYNLSIDYYKEAAGDPAVINSHLKNALNDFVIITTCPNTDKVAPTFDTYKNLPSASLTYTGKDYRSSKCTLRARTIASGSKVYTLYTFRDEEAKYNQFLESMQIK